MSAADSLARAAVGGKYGSLVLAATGAFSQTMSEASQKGATPEQAFLLATADAGLEVLTEKVSLDNLLDIAKSNSKGAVKFILNTLGQGGVEISEEEASFFGSILAEAAILQGKSEYRQRVGELVVGGMSYEEAKAQADKEVLEEAKNTAIVSGLSGTMSGSLATVYGKLAGASTEETARQAEDATTVQDSMQDRQAQPAAEKAADAAPAAPESTPPGANESKQAPQGVEAAKPSALDNAISKLRNDGLVSNRTADAVIADPNAMQQLADKTGLDTRGMTDSERRNAVKDAVRQVAGDGVPAALSEDGANSLIEDMGQAIAGNDPAAQEIQNQNAEPSENPAWTQAVRNVLGTQPEAGMVDTRNTQVYNGNNELQGGNDNAGTADTAAATAGTELHGAAGEGVRSVQNGTESYSQSSESGAYGQGNLRGPGELLLSDTAKNALAERGSPNVPMDSWTDAQTFKNALDDGRNSDVKNGWCVSPKELSDLTEPGVQMYLARNGEAGFVIKNGDIEAVFTNKAKGAPKGLADSLMLRAISAGGDRLDCYGEVLATLYSKYGFEPVARVAFNQEYANEGWTPDKGTPWVYVMKHNGDSADTVAGKLGTYPDLTKDRLDDLPTFGKNDYDKAIAYRDSLMSKTSAQKADTSVTSARGGQAADGAEAGGDSEEHGAVGAANQNFSGNAAYDDLLSDDNVQPARASDAKNVEVPKTDTYGRNVSEFAQNAMNSDIISERDVDTAKRLIQEGAFGHETQKMADVRDKVYSEIQEKGVSASVREVGKAAASGKISEYDIAKAEVLFAILTDKKGARAENMASDLLVDLSEMATQSGRQLNMFKLLRRLTPEGQLMSVQKGVQRNVEKMVKSGQVKKGYEPSIDPELEQDYLNAAKEAKSATDPKKQKDAERRMRETENAIYAAEAAKMPATFKAKWDAWRYMSMLGNVKTQARNIAGNAMFMPYKAVKDKMGALMEKALPKEERTKSLTTDRELLRWAKDDAKSEDVQDALRYSAKLGDDVSTQKLSDDRKVFDSKVLETIRQWTQKIPEAGDMLFKNPYYAKSLAGFLRARGYSAGDVQSGKVSDAVLNEGRSYAINEAMKATFNDCNAFSDFMANELRYKGDNPVGKAANLLAEGVLPFRRTPANIVVRFTEYSPAGVRRGVYNMGRSIVKGDVTSADAIDQIAAGLTGTAAMALGAFLASGAAGVKLTGSDTDDDEKREGHQDYALEFSVDGQEYSYKIDWAAPANMPLFVGANIYKMLQNAGEDTDISKFTAVLRGMGTMMEPMLSLSCLSSLNDLFESARYADDGGKLYAVAASMATSYFTQGIPALARQAYQFTQEYKQSTFANSDDPTIRDAQKTAANIPFLGALFQTDKVNAWGEKEKNAAGTDDLLQRITGTEVPDWISRAIDSFGNPGTLKKIDNSDLEQEITRLNGVQENSVTPPDVPKIVSYTDKNGEIHLDQRLTEEQYQAFSTVQGKTAERIASKIIASKDYAAMTDEQKAKALNLAYEYARDKGLSAAFPDYAGLDGWKRGINMVETDVILQKVARDSLERAMSDVSDAWKNGWDASQDKKALETAYKTFEGMGKLARNAILRDANTEVKNYVAAREAGISQGWFLTVKKAVDGIEPESGYLNANQKQKAETIANFERLPEDQRELLLKMYVSDSQGENIDEVQALGFDLKTYASAYRLYEDYAHGKGKKAATVEKYMKEYHIDKATAEALYKCFS
ncbi:MAG: hypothetical protein ACI3V5_08235 [Faecousia sp.]